jgi:hypothetical protein
MQESDWGEAPKPKGRIPAWAWWTCGTGCLVVVLAAVVLGFFFVGRVKQAMDPEVVWSGVAEYLPHDTPHADWDTMLGGKLFGAGQYHLLPPEPAGCQFLLTVSPTRSMLDPHFDPEAPQNKGAFGVGALEEAELGTLLLQGREVRTLTFLGGIPGRSDGAGIRVDLSPEEGAPHVFVQILVPAATEKLSPETVERLFEPFDVWRGR